MTKSDIQKELLVVYPAELVNSLINSYENAIKEYKKTPSKRKAFSLSSAIAF